MKILVTGGSGFVGRNLIKELIKLNHTVYSFSRSSPNINNCHEILGDISNFQDLLQIPNDLDAIFHTASKVGMWGNPLDFYKINVEGSQNIVKICHQKNIPILIYTSSPSVIFSKSNLEGVNERTPYPKVFLNEYSKTKAYAEKLLLSNNNSGFKVSAIRPHLIYGKDDTSLIPKLIEAAQANRLKIIGNGKNLVDVTHIDRVVDAHIKLLNALKSGLSGGKAYFIGDPKPVNPWDFINQILGEKNIKPVTKKIPLKVAYSIGWCFELFFSFFKIYHKEPPMTRFVALNLANSHYFSHEEARIDFGFN